MAFRDVRGGLVRPFEVAVPDATLERIAAKLALAEVGYAPRDEDPWRHGTSAAYLRGFLEHWRDRYDWRAAEGALNRFPQFKALVEDVEIHFYHVRGSSTSRHAIILTHGWPGSVVEFLGVEIATRLSG